MTAVRVGFPRILLGLGYAFLYAPIALLVIYSFNESRLVTVWGGFSTRWYGEVLANERIVDAAWLSLSIAAMSATVAVLLGTPAGFALARFGRFSGRTVFAGLLAAPLVMPEVITGLSLLLLFVGLEESIGWPNERGMATIVIAHVSFTMPYVAIVVQARLAGFDRNLEEAALDLGARPLAVLRSITLPLTAPAIVAGWLLSFTLSFDDLVIASFVTGPGATTLPMLIFSSVRLGLSPQINALATMMLVAVSLCLVVAAWMMGRRQTVSS